MGSTRRRFTDEYKANAVSLVLDDGHTIAATARNIDVHEMTLGKWVKKERDIRESKREPDAPLTESERTELVRLREESKRDKEQIAHLQMQANFAKKVATWFAKEQQ